MAFFQTLVRDVADGVVFFGEAIEAAVEEIIDDVGDWASGAPDADGSTATGDEQKPPVEGSASVEEKCPSCVVGSSDAVAEVGPSIPLAAVPAPDLPDADIPVTPSPSSSTAIATPDPLAAQPGKLPSKPPPSLFDTPDLRDAPSLSLSRSEVEFPTAAARRVERPRHPPRGTSGEWCVVSAVEDTSNSSPPPLRGLDSRIEAPASQTPEQANSGRCEGSPFELV